MDCYKRCLCATCTKNDTCKNGCDMCEQLKACRFIIARGKCPEYEADNAALHALALEQIKQEAPSNGS